MPRACFLLILWLLCLRVVCFVLDVGIFCFMCLVYLGDALFSLMNYLLIKKIYCRFQLSLSLSKNPLSISLSPCGAKEI